MTEIVKVTDSVNLDELQRMAQIMAHSGYFAADNDPKKSIAQMAVKILAGRELGYGPFASVNGVHVIQGKPTISANLMAAAVKAHPRYNYKILKMDANAVSIEFFEDGVSAGPPSEFTMAEAQAAGLANKPIWKQFPRNMLFARALSNGVRWYCPDVFNGNTVYVPEELGADVDGEGNITGQPAYTVIETTQTPQKPLHGHTAHPEAQAPQVINVAPVEPPTEVIVEGKDEYEKVLNELLSDDTEIADGTQNDATRVAFHVEGNRLFGKDWDKGARSWLVEMYTKKTTPRKIRSSSKQLVRKELETLTANMQDKAKGKTYVEQYKIKMEKLQNLETQMHSQLVAAAA
jgi:hypothetical protein